MLKDIAIGFVVFLGLSAVSKKILEYRNKEESQSAEGCGCNHNKKKDMER